ncbi:MAG: DUF2326 domain-containing protein [Neisseria sp.]|uniref:DUF2326 domain-containing protein n=1 Tax=Neisseria sp. TaxID=192066 RepID=UPI0026DABF1E|nr:DUF2326 domain-containing protein [Neisseria sp.]MDO4248222.1 DUF2326 domain-containing protein [Neisseria sp.]
MLKKLWSPTNLLLEDIQFHPGLNLIIGQYSEKRSTQNQQSHGQNGIGKSSIVRLIDYLLLSYEAGKLFGRKKYDFLREQKHEICLLLEVKDGLLQIRRNFHEPKRIYLKQADQPELAWDIEEAKKVFSDIFFPRSQERNYPNGNYRNLMSFFIKDDLDNAKRDTPTNYVQHGGINKSQLILLNLYLLGLPCSFLNDLLNVWDMIGKLQDDIKILTNYLIRPSGKSIGQLRSELAVKEKNLIGLHISLQEFKLNESFKNISEAIAEIEQELTSLRRQERQIAHQLEKLHSFTQTDSTEINIEDIRKQYEAVVMDLGRMVSKCIEDVLYFRESITQERLKFYGNRINELSREQKKLLDDINNLDTKRAVLLNTLDNDTDMSLTEAWGQYALAKAEAADTRAKLDSIEKNNNELSKLQYEANICQMNARNAIQDYSDKVEGIRTLFKEIVEAAFTEISYEADGAYLDIATPGSLKKNSVPIKIETGFPRSEALGQTKLATVVYDLTVMLNAVREKISLPDFLIHDGVFHGVEIRKKVNLLNFIQTQGEQYNFQYIVTFNEEEMKLSDTDKMQNIRYQFDIKQHTVIHLKDSPDEMLFGFSFG